MANSPKAEKKTETSVNVEGVKKDVVADEVAALEGVKKDVAKAPVNSKAGIKPAKHKDVLMGVQRERR